MSAAVSESEHVVSVYVTGRDLDRLPARSWRCRWPSTRSSTGLEAAALALPHRYGLPEQTPHVTGNLSALRSWISGNNAWSQETSRYRSDGSSCVPAER